MQLAFSLKTVEMRTYQHFFFCLQQHKKRCAKILFPILLAGFSEVESKATTSSEANRKVKVKGLTADGMRANSANLRPQKPLQKKGWLLSYKFMLSFQLIKLIEIHAVLYRVCI